MFFIAEAFQQHAVVLSCTCQEFVNCRVIIDDWASRFQQVDSFNIVVPCFY